MESWVVEKIVEGGLVARQDQQGRRVSSNTGRYIVFGRYLPIHQLFVFPDFFSDIEQEPARQL